jgi:hypothetical protein
MARSRQRALREGQLAALASMLRRAKMLQHQGHADEAVALIRSVVARQASVVGIQSKNQPDCVHMLRCGCLSMPIP